MPTWEELTASQKRDELFRRWVEPEGVQFVNQEAARVYKERATRIRDVVEMRRTPDRVPVFLIPSLFPAFYSGLTPREVMYDYNKMLGAWKKFVFDFQPDAHGGCVAPGPGPMFDILDYKLYSWPGHGVAPTHTYQAIEGEYMKADEYDAFIDDTEYFFSNIYPPRIYGALGPFTGLPDLSGIGEMYGLGFNFIPYGVPPVQAAFKALLDAGSEALKWVGAIASFEADMKAAGFPPYQGGATKAPFDMLGDTLRGTRGIMVDIFRRPEKLLEAIDKITPIMIRTGATAAKTNGCPMVFIPLHKGADGFLSDEQFRRFYWPSLKDTLEGLIAEGVLPFCWAEGGYESRLKAIRDMPRGKTAWLFDQTDIGLAKEAIGDIACVGGTMSTAMLKLGTRQQVRDHVKKCIDAAAKGGAYIMANGAFFDEVNPMNLKAMVEATKEYGVYG